MTLVQEMSIPILHTQSQHGTLSYIFVLMRKSTACTYSAHAAARLSLLWSGAVSRILSTT